MVPIGRGNRSGDGPAEGPLAELTAQMRPHGPAAEAAARLLRSASEHALPAGLREVAAALGRKTPAAEAPAEPRELLDALRDHPCLVVSPAGIATSADTVAAAVGDGKHALVCGTDPAKLDMVRKALPAPLQALCVDGPLPLSEDEQRELRALLLTQTPGRRARIGQQFPDDSAIPNANRIAALSLAVSGPAEEVRDSIELVPQLLNELSPTRFTEITAIARSCREALRALDSVGIAGWSRPLIQRVLFGPAGTEFAELLASAENVASAAEALSGAGYRMGLVGPPPPDAVERLSTYIDYLESHGRARRYFAPIEQRAVAPLLRQLGLDRAAGQDVETLRQALVFLRLTQNMRQVAAHCERLQVPTPKLVPAAVERRQRELERVDRAIRAVAALRHEILFIHPSSPIAVPDLDTAEQAYDAIIRAAEALPPARAELAELAEQLDESVPPDDRAPEVADLVAAVRNGRLADFRAAVDRLSSARHEQADQLRHDELLARLRKGAPRLAEAWEEPDTHRYTQGTARFLSLDELFASLPTENLADVLILLEGHTLQPDSLLASAAARRLVVMAGPVVASQRRPSTPATPRQDTTAAALLTQAGVPVVTPPTSRPVTVPLQRLESPEGTRSDRGQGGSLFSTGDDD